ncbi:type 1 glutamine amidotransferase domain-containing protein [Marinomonas mediterranea]|jgi:Putative intracellular protease/amidase|uniref:ThiJ/PfpI domain-containing protein n=1 Tax=Marinomonas mediterranea (strain ATCC 700492 / JCM 21426 / NBRC 103028 / MMB-1) TaxID=717774 RepID=F2K425_MARM1|nr:type 1 glutamine amidotransferase domain-containing protein [Marinomonas mediterranea]ADZ91367.1 ThiJ/PfpI domain-containing protein [Marinomonas mediterranea MMB-1]WCN09340.1 hypothetical protein GV055_10575 [Marinomonas mediterranea]WCN13417.1 hypothetical protein GV054_10565 [Marinomonas mediterranea]WCN17485.1 hypothetical protein GV053_10690 [Marinomonas mediterranea MMB-1]
MHILIILSEVSKIEGIDGMIRDTGYWLEEFALPYKFFSDKDIKITVATLTGKDPVPDPASTEIDSVGVCKNWENPDLFEYGIQLHQKLISEQRIISLKNLDEKTLKSFDGVFIPGGYAPMVDLVKSEVLGEILWYFHRNSLPTALFCHGPIALLSTQFTEGGFAYKGYRTTAFSSEEELDTELGPYLNIDVQEALSLAGMQYQKGDKWTSFLTKDRELITGQNTQSTIEVMFCFFKELRDEFI